jgi:hypothetical protein
MRPISGLDSGLLTTPFLAENPAEGGGVRWSSNGARRNAKEKLDVRVFLAMVHS